MYCKRMNGEKLWGAHLNFAIDRGLQTHRVGEVKVATSTRARRLWDEGWRGGVRDLGGLRCGKRASRLCQGGLLFLY